MRELQGVVRFHIVSSVRALATRGQEWGQAVEAENWEGKRVKDICKLEKVKGQTSTGYCVTQNFDSVHNRYPLGHSSRGGHSNRLCTTGVKTFDHEF